MTRLKQINDDSRLYVISESGGYSCLGFDVLETRIAGYASHLRSHGKALPFDTPAAIGTQERFQQYESTERAFMLAPTPTETWFDVGTPEGVRSALESARRSGQRVRLFYGDTETGKAWPEENDVAGTIGRSMGPMKVPLIIANARSSGGPAILVSSIVAIAIGPNRFSYRHPQFSVGQWAVIDSDLPEYAAAVTRDGELQARFKTVAGAQRYIGFMTGQRMAK